jgi:magnesium-protoporphyrin IX monomethyl ester (oxidative) cyclase
VASRVGYDGAMAGFRSVALLQSHLQVPAWHIYYVPDLVELCMLAAVVRDRVDDVAIPVSPTDRDPYATFERFMRARRPELVGISSFTGGAVTARTYAEIAKRLGAFVVVGGYHASALPEEVLRLPHVDAVVRGEGEEAFAELVRSGSPEGIPGVSHRGNGGFVHNPQRPPIADLDAFPPPLREIRPPRFGLAGLDYHTDTIYGSRGCRGKCVFCANHLVGGAWRGRSLEQQIAELETIRPPRRGRWKYVKFWDSCFLEDPERVAGLCTMILGRDLNRQFRFIAETRAEDVVRAAEILPLMRRAGFVRIGCGVESPSRATHRTLRKGLNLSHVERAAELLTAANIQFTKFLIVGHAGESEADILAYPDYSLDHGVRLQNTTFFVMTPYPGTELAASYRERGLIESEDWNLYTNFGAVVAPNGIPSTRLQVLHAAVGIRYGALRRFLAGKGMVRAAEKLVEPLLLLTKVELVRGLRSSADIAAAMHDALAAAGTSGSRTRPTRRRLSDRLALRFHLADGRSVAVGVVERGGEQELAFRAGPARLDSRRRHFELHVSLERLVALGQSLDYQRLGSDGMTLYWRAGRFGPLRVPTFAADIGRVLAGVGSQLAFNLRVVLTGRAGRPVVPPAA